MVKDAVVTVAAGPVAERAAANATASNATDDKRLAELIRQPFYFPLTPLLPDLKLQFALTADHLKVHAI